MSQTTTKHAVEEEVDDENNEAVFLVRATEYDADCVQQAKRESSYSSKKPLRSSGGKRSFCCLCVVAVFAYFLIGMFLSHRQDISLQKIDQGTSCSIEPTKRVPPELKSYFENYGNAPTDDALSQVPSTTGATVFCHRKADGSPLSVCTCQNPLLPYRPPPSDPYAERWTRAWKRNVAIAEKQSASSNAVDASLDVVLLGDSITEHWLGTELGEPADEWLDNAAVFDQFFQGVPKNRGGTAVNGLPLGIAGDKTYNVLFRLQQGELPDHLNPKVWWILIGTNDLYIHCSEDSILAGILRIVQEIQTQRPDAYIVLNSILPRTYPLVPEDGRREDANTTVGERVDTPQTGWLSITRINQQLQCKANELEGVEFFNATNLFVKQRSDTKIGSESHEIFLDRSRMPDGLHPNAAGSRVWGNKIVKTVARLIGERKLRNG